MRISTINITSLARAALATPAMGRGASLCVDDLIPPPAYGAFRKAHQQKLIAHRRTRTVALGPAMRVQFEDLLTVSYQVQEMLRAERIDDDAGMQREIDAYAHLLPDGRQWKATLLIELPHAAERARTLPQLSRAAHAVYVEVARQRTTAFANEDLTGTANARHLARPSGVHFLRFALPEGVRAALRAGADATLGCDDAQYAWRQPIAPVTLNSLRRDLWLAAPFRHATPLPSFT